MGYRRGLVLSLVFGFLVRLVPEALSFPYPIGFDTVHYAARMKSGIVWHHWSSVFSTWLLYAILIPTYRVVQVDPFLLLKLVAPMLYGLNVCGIYYFAKRTLGWETRNALMAAFFFAFQLAALRISWDLYRNVLGLGILLFALPFIRDVKTKKGFVLFVLLSTLVVFSHELVSVVMFVIVLGVMIKDFLKGRKRRLLRAIFALLPALGIFLTSVYLRMFPVPFHVETNVISVGDSVHPSPGGLFFLTNYLSVSNRVHHYSTYLDLFSSIFLLFIVIYLLCLPLVFVGFFRDKVLDGLTLLLLIGSFSSLMVPFCALDFWNRWMFMLVYPFTFYAVNGLGKVWELKSEGIPPRLKWLRWMKVSKRTVLGILLLTVLLGSLFMVSPLFFGVFGVFCIPRIHTYFPSTMLHNTVPLQDVEGTVEAMDWLNEYMNDGSCVLVHDSFFFWTELYLNKNHVVIFFASNLEAALNLALENGFNSLYFIWWNEDIGWYGFKVLSDFVSVFESGRISVFQIL